MFSFYKNQIKVEEFIFVWIIIKLVSTSYFPIFVGNGGPVAMDTGLVEQFCWCHDPMVLGCYQYTKYHQILWGSISKLVWCLARITLNMNESKLKRKGLSDIEQKKWWSGS